MSALGFCSTLIFTRSSGKDTIGPILIPLAQVAQTEITLETAHFDQQPLEIRVGALMGLKLSKLRSEAMFAGSTSVTSIKLRRTLTLR